MEIIATNTLVRHKKSKIKEDRVFNIVVCTFLVIFAMSCVVPIFLVVMRAFGSFRYNTFVIPRALTLGNFSYVLNDERFFRAFGMSVLVSISGVVLSGLVVCFAAYPLSKKDFPLRREIMIFLIAAMLFSGGLVPFFLIMREYRLLDTPFALVLPGIANVFNLILMKNYFEGLPTELEEAAKIDGAQYARILFQIIIPLSMPMLATLSLFLFVAYWNSYMTPLIMLPEQANRFGTLQLYLFNLIQDADGMQAAENPERALMMPNIEAAAIVLSIIPVLLIYPFVMKHFSKGIVIGSVKG